MSNDLEQTFLKLVRENDARLWKVCRVYARDADTREDLHQEMLVQLWRSLPGFAGASLPATWLYRVALNTALAHKRRMISRRESALEDHIEMAATGPRADEQFDAAQRLEQLHAAIDRLNEIDKALVTMYLDERSYRDMADVLGISESYVGVKLHRIRKELSGQLAEEDP